MTPSLSKSVPEITLVNDHNMVPLAPKFKCFFHFPAVTAERLMWIAFVANDQVVGLQRHSRMGMPHTLINPSFHVTSFAFPRLSCENKLPVAKGNLGIHAADAGDR